jgi:hypothetical protein
LSGQLVGEVLDASDALRAQGLSERGFHALVAIAEKAHVESRQGSVPWKHIRAGLFGASQSTAKRAIADLKAVGAIVVVKRGFDNHSGRKCAPIYEIQALEPELTTEGEQVTQVTHSTPRRTGHSGDLIDLTERPTQVTQSPSSERVKSGGRMGHIGDRTAHPGDPLNGSTNGPTNRARERGLPKCTGPDCQICSIIRKALHDCDDCDDFGRLDDDLTDCPLHGNFRQHRPRTRRAS